MVNYRSEPATARYLDNDSVVKDPSHVFASIPRGNPLLDRQPPQGDVIPGGSTFKFSEPFPGAGLFDPYTPLLRAYENDDVQVRVLIGAHFVPHSFNLHGLKWLNEATDTDSGYISTQVMSISEHFEMLFRLPPTAAKPSPQANVGDPPAADYLYLASSDIVGLDNGVPANRAFCRGVPRQAARIACTQSPQIRRWPPPTTPRVTSRGSSTTWQPRARSRTTRSTPWRSRRLTRPLAALFTTTAPVKLPADPDAQRSMSWPKHYDLLRPTRFALRTSPSPWFFAPTRVM